MANEIYKNQYHIHTVYGTYSVNHILRAFKHDNKRNIRFEYYDYKVNKYKELHFVDLSLKMEAILKSQKCKNCGIKGNVFMLEAGNTTKIPHFNLYYKSEYEEIMLTPDHIIPKYKGGLNIKENIQVLCEKCNSAKGSTVERKYFTRKFINKITKIQPNILSYIC